MVPWASTTPLEAVGADASDRARVAAAIAVLPPPYCQAMTLKYVTGWNNGQIADWLMAWSPLSEHGARKILKEGRRMLESAILGELPRQRWPRRYLRESAWSSTPPPPLREL